MCYLNYLFLYSIFGFLMESTVYKIGQAKRHSGILFGPYTFVYGFGVLISILTYEFIEKNVKFKNKIGKIIFYFFLFTILLTLVEYLGGTILHSLFNVDMWNYSHKKFSFGKYVCLFNSVIWGILATINIYYIYPYLKKIIKKIPSLFTVLFLLLVLFDVCMTILFKITFSYFSLF